MIAEERAGNHFAEWSRPRPALWQGLPTLPPGRPEVSSPDSRRETCGPAHGGVGRPAPNRESLPPAESESPDGYAQRRKSRSRTGDLDRLPEILRARFPGREIGRLQRREDSGL